MSKKQTKQTTWNEAVAKAQEAIQELIDIQDACQEKYNELTEEQQGGEEGIPFIKITDLDLQNVLDTLMDATDIEIPSQI